MDDNKTGCGLKIRRKRIKTVCATLILDNYSLTANKTSITCKTCQKAYG